MLRRLMTPIATLLILILAGIHFDSEWLIWFSAGFCGIIMIDEFNYRQLTAADITIQRLNLIISKLKEIMTKEERLQKAIEDLNAGTNEIAADLQKLKDEIAAGNVSEESLAALETNIAVLTELGTQQ